jgi:DNA-binding LacI/PurR family transcriptional regulator
VLRQEISRLDPVVSHKLPSDAELSGRFVTSRLTVIKSLRQLQSEGLVQRRAGSGTYSQPSAKRPGNLSHTFGLLIPDLGEGEIFEPICQGMASAGKSTHQALIWGNSSEADKGKRALELCEYFIGRKVSGVFFAPLELAPNMEEVNAKIIQALDRERIPTVLLDRNTVPFPLPPTHDLVGIDNWREGFRIAEHLLNLGSKRVGFVVMPGSAPTVEARIAGLAQALWQRGDRLSRKLVFRGDPSDVSSVQRWLNDAKPDGVLCANDFTAARLMHTLLDMGIDIPGDVRILGFDDVKYATLLPVPLTTLRQPCHEIGAAAVRLMLERLENPLMSPRTVCLPCEIVIRRSCGAGASSH